MYCWNRSYFWKFFLIIYIDYFQEKSLENQFSNNTIHLQTILFTISIIPRWILWYSFHNISAISKKNPRNFTQKDRGKIIISKHSHRKTIKKPRFLKFLQIETLHLKTFLKLSYLQIDNTTKYDPIARHFHAQPIKKTPTIRIDNNQNTNLRRTTSTSTKIGRRKHEIISARSLNHGLGATRPSTI